MLLPAIRSIIGATKALEMIQNGVVLPSVAKRQKKVPTSPKTLCSFFDLVPGRESERKNRHHFNSPLHSRVQKNHVFFSQSIVIYSYKLQVELVCIPEAFGTARNLFRQWESESRLVNFFSALDCALVRRKSRTRSCSSEWRRRR